MSTRLLAREAWASELDSFSRQHEGWLVSITLRAADGQIAHAARDLPLQGISPISHDFNDIAVTVGNRGRRLTHDVRDATAMRIELTPDQAERALIIETQDGATTTIEFRSPMRVEDVDGLPAPGRF